MKTSAGNLRAALPLLCLIIVAPLAHARLTASVDRTEIALGETVRLTLTGDAGERPDDADFRALERDFDILNRSSATNARLINGSQTVTRTLELELSPKRVGLVTIPSFVSGGRASTPIAIKVSPAPDIDAGDALVLFDAAVDRDNVYVQAQLLLTVTLQQAINLDQREVTPPEIPGADIEMLEQRTFQRQLNGRLWQVIELRYAIFPQQSGELTIPSLTFSGREILPGRSLLGARLGRRIAIDTEPMSINVKPVPADFPGSVWLPAKSLSIEEKWSKPPASLTLGDSTTRTLTVTAEGLQGTQLPPIEGLDQGGQLAGLRFYPGEESIDQTETTAGLTGRRVQSEALVPSQPGRWALPEQTLAWWNTETDQLEYARIPAREIDVAAVAAPALPAVNDSTTAPSPASGSGPAPLWLWVVAGSGWLATALIALLWWRHDRARHRASTSAATTLIGESERRALVALRLACQQNDPTAARQALLTWARIRFDDSAMGLDGLVAMASPELATQIRALNKALYGTATADWQGQALFAAARDLPRNPSGASETPLSLYPA